MTRKISFILHSQKGQLAVFVALIFQVLFVMFAMVINIGLLVHHKINLQNSVDLAAYYGAMKQAQTMNAMAHINYQIKQANKLLFFRYLTYGMSGRNVGSPVYPYIFANGQDQYLFGSAPSTNTKYAEETSTSTNPGFCIGYRPFNVIAGATENFCKDPANSNITLPEVPVSSSPIPIPGNPFDAILSGITSFTERARMAGATACTDVVTANWFLIASFMGAYKSDLANRKKLFILLANKLSGQAPKDLDNQDIRTGVYKTFYKNLTYPNQESIESKFGRDGTRVGSTPTPSTGSTENFIYYNSLSDSQCSEGGTSEDLPKWLAEIYIWPLLKYYISACGYGSSELSGAGCPLPGAIPSNSNIAFTRRDLNSSNPTSPGFAGCAFPADIVTTMIQFLQEGDANDPKKSLYRSSMGFEKNPWCVVYTGVSAQVTPKIPFSPFGDVTIRAKAFAKPFGGVMGPWYGKNWRNGSAQSEDNNKTDPNMPDRFDKSVPVSLPGPDPRREANYSRFPGDTSGIKALNTTAYNARMMHKRGVLNGEINQDWFLQLSNEPIEVTGTAADVLAWDSSTNKAPPLRYVELAAIAPTEFEALHYSIDADYAANYLTKIKTAFASELPGYNFRADLGARNVGPDSIKGYNVFEQINVAANQERMERATPAGGASFEPPRYVLNNFGPLLTGWRAKNAEDYTMSDAFTTCSANETPTMNIGDKFDADRDIRNESGLNNNSVDPKFKVAGGCATGGRVGYSVKLVDPSLVDGSVALPLGGENEVAPLKNPFPADLFR